MVKITSIQGVGNYYGHLEVKEERRGSATRYYMRVTCEVSNPAWVETSQVLYTSLLEVNKK